jgi:hypothetical protein
MSVRGVLCWPPSKFRAALSWIKRDDGTPYDSEDELRNAFMDELAKGHEVIPMGDCDNFDYKTGCLGHECEDELERLPLLLRQGSGNQVRPRHT